MRTIQRRTIINAPAEAVFALLTDTTRFGEWVYGYKGSLAGPERLTADSTHRWRQRTGWFTIRPRATVTAFTPNNSYEETIRVPGLVRATLTKTVEPTKRRTQLSWDLEYTVTGGPLGRLIDWLIARRIADRTMRQSLARARELLETERATSESRGGYRRQTAVR